MQVQVNGESREVNDHSTLEDLVRELSLSPARVAIELNRDVVRRGEWAETHLSENDRIEIVHFVGGGTTVGMQSVPGAVATGSRLLQQSKSPACYPIAAAPGTDLIVKSRHYPT